MMIPPSKFHLVEIREDGTVVLEVGEQKGTEEILKEAVEQIGYSAGDGDRAYREGLQKKVSKIVDRRIAERRKQGMFDPRKNSPIEEERFTTTADTAASGAGFTPDSSPRPPRRVAPSRFDTNDDDIGTGDFDDDLSPDERRWRMEEMRSRRDDTRFSSGAKWGQMPASNEQLARLLEPSNNDGFNEIYGPPQTREERITQMAEMQSEVMTSLREMFDNVPGAGDSLGLDLTHIDPVLADFIKNSSDQEIYKLIAESAKNLHESFDARPRVRMRQDELDKFAASGRYGREGSFDTERLSSGLVKKGIRARAKERAIEMISERIGKDEDSKEIAEMFLGTVSALKFGPEAALTRLAIDLGRRGSRDVAERTVQELIDRGKITDEQAKSILSKLDKIAPDGLPEPLKRGVGRAARATADALDTPENRDRLEQVREAAGDAAGRAREAVGEGARNMAERGRERLRKLRERDDAGSLPSAPDDVPFGDFDPADAPVDPFSSGRRLDRRVSGSDAGRERIMEGASVTRTRLSSGETPKKDKPKKPSRPRDPDNGPMTGKFIDIFRGVKSYQEMLDRYNEQEVIFFDYETTGFDPKVEKPVQIGAVKMKGGKVIERFNIFVNPDRELSDWSKENLVDADGNPLTNDWLSGQPSIAEGHQQLIDFFGPDALLGGQYTPFDLSFLEESLKGAGIEWTPAGVMDSKALADELLPRWTADGGDGPFALNPDGTKYATNSLGPLSEYLEVELTAWHTADADSEASAMIVQKILERAAEREDVPKHLLDVDNLPNVVTERKARHKLEMDKYFADMKQYKVDNDAYEASQAGERLASGEMMKPVESRQIGLSPNAVGSSYWLEDGQSSITPYDGSGRFPGRLPPMPIYREMWESILPSIEADRKKREAEEAARLVNYAQMLRPHNWGHQIDKPLSEMSDTELKLHLKYLDGSEPHGYPALGLDGWKAQKAEIEKEFRRRRISTNFTSAQKVEADQIVSDSNAQRAEREARNAAETAKRSEEMRARLPQPGTPEHARVEELNKNLIELEERRIKRMNVLRNLENPTDAEKAEYEAISQLDHPYMTAKTPRLVDDYKEWEKFATAREKQKRDVLDGKMGWDEAAKMLKERNQGYSDALYPKTKESEFKVGKVTAEKPLRFSSGETKRDLKPGSVKKETSEIVGTDNGYSKKKFIVHEIGDEKVVFGATRDNGADLADIKRVPINPYEISGYDRKSPEGQEFAMKWTAAHAAHMAENDMTASTEVDALLYAAARGDSDAMKEFELLAAKGERLIEEERKLQSRESLGWSRPWEGNPEWNLNEAYDNASKAAIKKEGLEDLSIKDLYLVHETKYDLVEDADGNIILRPLGDHELKKVDGTPGEYNRDTLHFALNHLAGGHMMRQEQEGNVIIVPLSAVLEKNPDSLDALFAVDTYLVPKPGEPLVIPKGAFRTIPKGSSNPREEAEKALKEMGATHIFEAGDTHSSQGVDGKVRQIASDMGIQSTAHANIVHSYMEQKISDNEPEYNVMARELAQMSPNARMRLADNDRFSSVKTEVDNTRMFSGEVIKPNGGAAKPNTEADTPTNGEGPRSKKPKRFKKYKGYTLKEPANPTGEPGQYPDDVVEAATKHRAEIEKVEAEITKLLIDLAEKNKARMEGLDFRLKALKSLMRKIFEERDSEHGGDAEKAAKSMSDVARYTMSYEPEDYIDGVKGVIAEMQKLGYDLRVKNYWKGDDPYQGINVAVTHPDGTKFELQFHTPQSVVDKEKIHLIYDSYRTETDPKKRWIMYNRMVRMANKIGVPIPPDELMSIGIVKEQPFTPR